MFNTPIVGKGAEEAFVVADWHPAVDIQESDKEYLVRAELPEVKKDEVKVEIQGGIFSIRGERKQEKEEKGEKFHRIERSYGTFFRSVVVPVEVEEKKIAAELKKGVLSVHLPKSEVPKATATEVKVA